MTPYTREQLEKMDDTDLGLQVGRWCDDFADDPDAWLTGDGMLALMEWCNARDMEVTLYNSTFSTHFVGWAATIEKPGKHADMVDVAWILSAPRALAIAFVLAMQEKQG